MAGTPVGIRAARGGSSSTTAVKTRISGAQLAGGQVSLDAILHDSIVSFIPWILPVLINIRPAAPYSLSRG